MRSFALFVVLLLAIPMLVLNPLGRGAFMGYYLGVVATWLAVMVASHAQARWLQTRTGS